MPIKNTKKKKREAMVKVALLAAFCFLFWLAAAADQTPPGSTVKGFKAPLQYFDPPHELQVQTFLEGSEAEPGADGLILIRNAKLQTYHEDGTKEMTATAPQCVYDSRQHTVSSAGPLQVQTVDNGMFILHEGVGFLWLQTNSQLSISNQVRTTINGTMTNLFTP
jgi:hypothetical protein